MIFEWDPVKSDKNQDKHGLAFEAVHLFDWNRAALFNRTRESDGEQRYAAVGECMGKLCTVIFTVRFEKYRIISLRRANKPEERAYAEQYN